ncbi:MAG: YcgN family cysteine cluster protein [Pseudomonadota bacterium]
MRPNFWKALLISEWTNEEWEALCDGCGKCCLIRLEDDDTGEIYSTDVHCKLYDGDCGGCSNYANRAKHVPDCVKLTPDNIYSLSWLPKTCAYRLITENRPLFVWHYLVSGSRQTIIDAGMSIVGKTTSVLRVKIKHLPKRIKVWEGE